MCLTIPFHSYQATFGRDEVIFLFFLFVFLNLLRSSPKPQNIEIQFLCKVVKLQTRRLPRNPPEMGLKKQFFNGLS